MPDNRRDELLGAALADDLTPQERTEFAALLRDDPTAREEWEGAAAVLRRLGTAGLEPGKDDARGQSWTDAEPPASLRERVLAATSELPESVDARASSAPGAAVPLPRRPGSSTRPWLARPLLVAASAALLLAGVGGGLGLAEWLDRPQQGAAGTLGAHEPVTFSDVPDGVVVSASVVAHTWGTETVFEEITGLTPGETYQVVLVAEDGSEVGAGSFEAVAGAVDCRMTSAAMREEVRLISVRTADGAEVMNSPLPEVAGA
ncbi:hypothetical protein E4P39_14670 [Blastococcus sp. CT_GayMR19]|uniref:hypothetical protein n=1 Tax=Blastococcus sp. CT_GayMR19 TaxID=2559608 RepID=UPI001073A757|nr:hypothetical protein [Blastococcus sp. CT_GayMR19]TFV73357.1 hypothetical protein E4P39_14670 [Blastococcus sp. CT_GayMR19]